MLPLLLLLLLVPALAAATSLPTLSGELAKCKANSTRFGQCVPYPVNGTCAKFFPNGALVYMPEGVFLADVEKTVATYIQTASSEVDLLGPECLAVANAITCLGRFIGCIPDPIEPLPVLPCIDVCEDFWSTCADVEQLVYSQTIKSSQDYNSSNVPNCAFLNTTFNASYGATPQPPDVWGGRQIGGWLPPPAGIVGQQLMPVSQYNYTYANGSTLSMQCYLPNETAIHDSANQIKAPPPVCVSPLVKVGLGCQLLCPFPAITSAEAFGIEAAYVAPGILGFILCLLVFADSLVLINRRFKLTQLLPFGSSSKEGTDSSTAPTGAGASTDNRIKSRRQNTTLRMSTIYAAIGSALGIVFFLIGPLGSLIYGSKVSCNADAIDVQQVISGHAPDDPLPCKAQRAAVFILQAMFNLVLYYSVKVFLVVDDTKKRFSSQRMAAFDVATKIYCIGLPILTLIIATQLDGLSTIFSQASVQLSRQAASCSVRLSEAGEWILVWTPFFLTGFLIVVLNLMVIFKVKRVRDKAAIIRVQSGRDDDALNALMTRLAVLGLLTFGTLVVVIVTSSVYTAQLALFAPAYADYVNCLVLTPACVDCTIWLNLAVPPSNAVVGIQLFAESFVTVIVGLFFASASWARIRAERNTPVLDSTGERDVNNTAIMSINVTNAE